DAPVLKSNYGTWGWTRQLRDAQILNRQHVCHDGFLVGSGSGMEGSQVLAETRRASLFASGSASGFASACVSISPIVSTPVDVLGGLEVFEISDLLSEVIGGLLLNLFGAMLPTKAGVRVGNGKTATAACSGAVGATGGRNDGISSLRFHFFLRDVGYHTPGGF